MTDRIDDVLDGTLPREALSRDEAAELDAREEAIAGALGGLRAEASPDLTRDVMARLAELPRHESALATEPAPWQAALAWLWQPRPVSLRLRPAYALAAAALSALLLLPGDAAPPASPAGGASAGAGGTTLAANTGVRGRPPAQVLVQFRLDAPDAGTVELAGDFTDWRAAYPLHEAAPGLWTVIVPLEPGVHQYAFVVDGERWVADPMAPRVDDGFGGSNSRLDVLPPAPVRSL